MSPVTVSKSSQWDCQNSFVKVPVRLLLCDALTSNAKLLWIALANQAGFRPISKSVLDLRLGVHRSTRSRLMDELRDTGFVTGTNRHIYLNDPIPVLDSLEAEDIASRTAAREEMLNSEDQQPAPKQVKPASKDRPEQTDHLKMATEAWNRHKPGDYQKINRLSSQLGKAIDMHMSALNLDVGDYDGFFSALCAGIDRSNFWRDENSSKTLQSITGIGSPTTKKFSNVYSLYNDGITPIEEMDIKQRKRPKQKRVIDSSLRNLIDRYDEAQHFYVEAAEPSSTYKHQLESRIRFLIQTEKEMKDAGLDPAEFRMMNGHVEWPTDTPAPSKSREIFWTYTDEVE